jgi:hypothetical protein
MGQHVGTRLLAGGRELFEPRDGRRLLAGRRGHRVGRGRHWGVRRLPAGHRITALDTPGVEHHDVEVIEQLRCQNAELVGHVVDTGHPGTAGVDDERPDAGRRILRRVPGHRDGDGRPSRVGIVQRHHERAALQVPVARRPGHGDRRGRCSGRRGGDGGRRGRSMRLARDRRATAGTSGREQRGGQRGGEEWAPSRRQPPDHRDHSGTRRPGATVHPGRGGP